GSSACAGASSRRIRAGAGHQCAKSGITLLARMARSRMALPRVSNIVLNGPTAGPKDPWSAFDQSRPLFAFAGIWRLWRARGRELLGFLNGHTSLDGIGDGRKEQPGVG